MATHLPRSTLAIMGMTEWSQTHTHALYTTFSCKENLQLLQLTVVVAYH